MTEFERERKVLETYINSDAYREKLQRRLKIQESCEKSTQAQLYAYVLSKQDPIFFIENFCWTFDPRPYHAPNHLPFFLFDYQVDTVHRIIKHIREGQDLFIDKSRDMGATWTIVVTFVYLWLFDDAFAAHIGSRKQELVDNRTIDSIYGIIDYLIGNLPVWMLPHRWKPDKYRLFMKLINPENQNLITGESMNPDFARGPRKKVVLFDEMAFWDYGMEAWGAAGDTTPCRIAVSTPNGYNFFALLKESFSPEDRISLHWRLHPLKNDAWYEFQKSRRTEEEVAQELDISYHKSQEGRVYPEWDSVSFGIYLYEKSLPLFVSWDFGGTDDTGMIWWQQSDKIRIIDCYWNRGKLIDFYIPFVTGEISIGDEHRYSRQDLQIVREHREWNRAIHFGDPAGRFTNQVTNQTVLTVLKNAGINVHFKESAKDFQTRKTAAKLLMRNLVVNTNDRTKYLSTCMYNASYPRIREVGGIQQVRSIKPVHNWTSHLRSAFEYFAVNYQNYSQIPMRVHDQFPVKKHIPQFIIRR